MLTIGPITIQRYGLMYLFAILIGWGILRGLGRQLWFQSLVGPKITHILQHQLDDLITWVVGGVIIGGRLGHVLIYDSVYYWANPLSIIKIREGGMAFVGGFIGVGLSIGYRVYRNRLTIKEFFILTDLIVFVLPIGIALGRWGNAINQELVGKVVDQSAHNLTKLQQLHLVRVYDTVDTQLRRNTNLLEGMGEGVLGFITTLILFIKQKLQQLRHPGLITGGFMIFYAIMRIILESLRDNPSFEYISIAGQLINKTQLWMIGFIIVGIVVIISGNKTKAQSLKEA